MTFNREWICLLRLSHWSKSIFVFLGLIYSNDMSYAVKVIGAALAFCLIASAVYIYNDIQDREHDRLHPRKCLRPLANKQVSLIVAVSLLLSLLVAGMFIGWLVSKTLMILLSTYLGINIVYNHFLKNYPIYDVLCVASGFMLRVLAGTLGVGLVISGWLTASATLLSLLIALSKRKLEKNLMIEQKSRIVLTKYSKKTLDELILLTSSASFFCYVLYTVFAHPESFYFILTLPFAAIGLFRFMWLIKKTDETDDPIIVLISDSLSRLNFLCFAILTVMALIDV